MSLSADQRRQLIQWIAALPQPQFDGLVFSLEPPPGTLSSPPAPIGTRAAELLNWAQSILGPGIPAVVAELRSGIESIAPQKLGDFDATFSGLQQTEGAEEICPYQGLEAFTPETRRFFHGRQETTELLVQKLTEFNFVPVIGASGSGKSSVVRAGLVPRLSANGWRVLDPIKPRVNPMASLELAISTVFQRATDIKKAQRLLHQQGLPPILEMLATLPAHSTGKTLLVIDQFEEVFTLCTIEAERARFIDCITAVQTLENSPLAIVTTMRADFVEQWLDYGNLVQMIQHQAVWLGRLQGDDLIQAIEKPAKDLGYAFGPGLLDFIVQDVQEEKNCLPLLEFALTELWEERDRQQKLLPLKAYQTMQGLKGALNKRAEDVYNDDLATDDERTWAKRICLELVRIGPDVKDTRQPQPREHLLALAKTEDDRDVIQEVIETLVEGRLLVTTKGDEVDLAHEALTMGWQRFAEWRQEDRDLRRLVQRANDAEKEWTVKGRREEYLLQAGLLLEVKSKWAILESKFNTKVRAFLQKSEEQDTLVKQATLEPELTERLRWAMKALSDRPHETAAYVISSAGENIRRLPQRGIASIHSGLRKIFSAARESGRFQGHDSLVHSVAFSPDGQKIVSGSWDNTLRMWDLEGNLIGVPFEGHTDYVNCVAFSPDGEKIVSGSEDGTIRIWDEAGACLCKPLRGHKAAVNSVAFSPDGNTIVSGSHDCTVRLWDVSEKKLFNTLRGHKGWVWAVAFSPDGNTIVSSSQDFTLRLWDKAGTSIGKPFKGHTSHVTSVVFSPNREIIVSGSAKGTIRMWDLDGNLIGVPFKGHTDGANCVAFSPDGKTIVSGSRDYTIRLWDLEGSPIGEPLNGHNDFVHSVAFSPDGNTIVSGGGDNTLRLWDLEDNSINKFSRCHTSSINSVAFSPNGQALISGSSDKTIRLWKPSGNPIREPFRGHMASVYSVAFSSDSLTIVSGSEDGIVQLWDIDGNSINEPFAGHMGAVWSVAFSPDGKIIVSSSDDGTVRLWNLEGHPIGDPFQGHTSSVDSVVFSPDGQTLVSGSMDGTIMRWDLSGNSIGKPFRGHTDSVWSVAYSPDGQAIVSGSSDHTVRLWDLEGDLISEPFRGHTDAVFSVAFSPDGTNIVSGSEDNTVRLWDLDGNPIDEFSPGRWSRPNSYVNSVVFSPDGQTIAIGSHDSSISLWRGGTWRDWLALCCNRFRYHPLFKNADREPFISACKVCEEYVWSQQEEGKE